MKEGILIAADSYAEELIPWWWSHYSRYNNRPVAIVDFGMSKRRKKWCQNRMGLISYPPEEFFVLKKEEIPPEYISRWTKNGKYASMFWHAREAWFKKPKACLLSQFDLTLWMDLDCEVCGSLDSIFAQQEKGIDLVILKEDCRLNNQQPFNSGVMLIRKNSSFLKEWDYLCKTQNGAVLGDQDILTKMILKGKVSFKELPISFNWLMGLGFHPEILVAHWAAGWGKEYIQKFGGLHALTNSLKEKE